MKEKRKCGGRVLRFEKGLSVNKKKVFLSLLSQRDDTL